MVVGDAPLVKRVSRRMLQISWNGVTQSLETLRNEAQKCVLLCSNCHAEVEDGLIELPATVSAEPSDIPP